MKENYTNYEMMNEKVKKKGSLYQYRGCYMDQYTIYDLENIRNQVLFARSPIGMNDPFDSTIVIDENKLLYEMAGLVIDSFDTNDTIKLFMKMLTNVEILGKFNTFLSEIIEVRSAFKKLSITLKKNVKQSYYSFYDSNKKLIDSRLGKKFTSKYGDSKIRLMLWIIDLLKGAEVTEQNIASVTKYRIVLENTREGIIDFKNNLFAKTLTTLQNKMAVTCLSASGWANELMWAHYASSYKGICVEYDFSKLNDNIGVINEVKYCKERPAFSLVDIGLDSVESTKDENDKFNYKFKNIENVNGDKIMEYLFSKHDVWDYEEEWRIVDSKDENQKMKFINVPFIKSVTFGYNIEPICKYLLIQICEEKNIDVYELKPSDITYSLERKSVNKMMISDYLKEVVKYISEFEDKANELEVQIKVLRQDIKELNIKSRNILKYHELVLNMLSQMFFYKKALELLWKQKTYDFEINEIEALKICNSKIDELLNEQYLTSNNIKHRIIDKNFIKGITYQELSVHNKQIEDVNNIITKINEIEWPF